MTKSTPPFSGCSSLIKFVCDGQRGLLGYTQSLAAERDILKLEDHLAKQMINTLKQQLEECKESNKKLQTQLKQARKKNTMLGDRQRESSLKNIEALRRGGGGRSRENQSSKVHVAYYLLSWCYSLLICYSLLLFFCCYSLLGCYCTLSSC